MVKRVAGMLFATAFFLAAQTMTAPPQNGQWGQGGSRMAQPGALNYVEGQASVNGRTVTRRDIGQAQVEPGQMLETQNGKAEMLLTPGVFLRLSDNSAVRMINPSISNTRVEVVRGEAMLEAAGVQKENHLVIIDQGVSTPIEKRGIYEFRADQPAAVLVFDGHVTVNQNDRQIDVGKGHELLLGQNKTHKFDRSGLEASDQLYSWSKVRSEYEAQANQSVAQTFAYGGPGWYGPGWYWDPYWDMWGFVPGAGFLYSPFGWGWGFWSPAYYGAYFPYGYGYGYGGFGYRGYRGFVGNRPGFIGHRGLAVTPHTVTPRMGGAFAGRGSVGGFGGGHVGGFSGRMGGFGGGHVGGFGGARGGFGGRR